jgi:diguanylate cyclase (GGDEF)-like protein
VSRQSRLLSRSLTRVNALTVALGAVALALFLGPVRDVAAGGPDLGVPWWAIATAFALAEVFVIHIPMARSAHTTSLREIPSVLALVFLTPSAYLAAALVGGGLALLLIERQRGSKLAFNISMYALEVCVAVVVQRTILGAADSASPRGWVAALVAMLVTGVLSCVLVTVVIMLAGDGFSPEILRQATTSGALASAANSSLALLVVVLLVLEPIALVLLGVVIAVVFLCYRAYVAFANRYSQLELLYGFVGALGASVDLDLTVASVLTEARNLVGAGRAELIVLPDGDRRGQHVVLIGESIEHTFEDTDLDEVWWSAALRGISVLVVRGEDRDRTRLPALLSDAMAVPVTIEGVIGVLIVANRLFAGKTFTHQDLRLFEALAGHASSTLQNARLADMIRSDARARDHDARHDPLTGLPNRHEFHLRFQTAATGSPLAVLMIDLDDFKEINDTLGRRAGDQVLMEIGNRLQQTSDGVVARLSGDEFVVLLSGVVDAIGAVTQAEALLDAIRQPVVLGDVSLVVSASIGIALHPLHGATSDVLLTHADIATYVAKGARTSIELYTPDPESGRHRRLALAAQMEAAIDSGSITLWYQPKLDAKTGKLVGVEGLVRWIHPVYGLVSPSEILPVAERTGLIRRLTDHLLETALLQQAQWRSAGLDMTVAVNITTRDLLDERLPVVVSRLISESGTRPDRLTLEITESGIMRDLDRCLGVLDCLAALGVKLSIDDFGTGYSSLAYLERLPVSEVKIDRSFVERLADPDHNSTVLRSTIQMSHTLGLSVVAEGVETQQVRETLVILGADVIQGFHMAYPMPTAAFAAWCEPPMPPVDPPRVQAPVETLPGGRSLRQAG